MESRKSKSVFRGYREWGEMKRGKCSLDLQGSQIENLVDRLLYVHRIAEQMINVDNLDKDHSDGGDWRRQQYA